MKRIILLTALAGLCGGYALADLPQLRSGGAEFVPVKRLARITPDGRIGPWIDVTGAGGIAQECGSEIIYDCLEVNTSDPNAWVPASGMYGVSCPGLPNHFRWAIPDYCNMFSVDDMTVKPGGEAAEAVRVAFSWVWDPEGHGGPIGGESCIVALFTTEDVSLDCTAPATGGTFSGVVYDFGVLPSGGGFYYTDTRTRLCDAGLSHEMPADGAGGTIMIFATEFNGLSNWDPATCAQPALWGTMDPLQNPPGTAPWSQSGVKWDDDDPRDGMLTENECRDFTGYVTCPDPLGNGITFGAGGQRCTNQPCGDVNCDGMVNGSDIDPFFLALGDPAAWQARYPTCDIICGADITKDCVVNGADIDAFFSVLCCGYCPPNSCP